MNWIEALRGPMFGVEFMGLPLFCVFFLRRVECAMEMEGKVVINDQLTLVTSPYCPWLRISSYGIQHRSTGQIGSNAKMWGYGLSTFPTFSQLFRT